MPITVLTREPGPSFVRAISPHPEQHNIDPKRALTQHRAYTQALKNTGAALIVLAPVDDFPDGPFVEDTAIIFPDRAVICPMKETSRIGETESIRLKLAQHLPIKTLTSPAQLDGGDVLQTEHTIFVGLSRRSNEEGAKALSAHTKKTIITVPVLQGLHLKTSATYLGNNVIVLHSASVAAEAFKNFDCIEVNDGEQYAANCLAVGKTILIPAGYGRIAGEIMRRGFTVVELEMSEFEKADGGLTCLSLIIPASA